MTPLRTKQLALLAVLGIGVLAWPGPAGADTSLGGYSGAAQALPVRIQIYEPVIPIPSSPQIDGGLGLSRATTDTGPVSRALASYLWPGDTIGDGFSSLVGNDKAKYPVQVNSRFPATSDSPTHNTAQLTEGNGMTTSSTESNTTAAVTGLGVAGPDTDLTSGLLKGLGQLTGQTPPTAASSTDLPITVGSSLARLGTVQGLQSRSSVTVGAKTLTSSAHAQLGTIDLLGGLVQLGGVDVSSTTTSNGKTSTATGSTKLGSISVAGLKAGFGDKGVTLGSTTSALPALPGAVTDVLKELGIQLKTFVSTRTVKGPGASLASTGLQVSIDTGTLKTRLGLGAVLDTVGQLLSKIPNVGEQLAPILGLGPRIVFLIGDVSSSVTAAPQYVGGAIPTAGTAPTHAATGGSTVSGSPGSTGGGGSSSGTGGGTGNLPAAAGGTGPAATSPVATGYTLPGLGAVPKTLILGGLLAALAVAWALRAAGALLFGGAAGCDDGLASGVPDLRKG